MGKELFTAIAFFPPEFANQPCKYRNVSNRQNFLNFAKRSGFRYVNWYGKYDKVYKGRDYLQ
jgi:hypothetical protein